MKIDEAAVVRRAADGKLVLLEEYADLSVLPDDELRALRGVMTDKYAAEMADFLALGDNRYSTPEGNAEMRDMDYYRECLRRVEYEMQCRMMTLD